MDAAELWNRYRQYYCHVDSLDLSLDISRMHFDDAFLASMEPAMQKAFEEMDALESGAIANPDEKRMVGHYWLRCAATRADEGNSPGDRRHGGIDSKICRRRARGKNQAAQRGAIHASAGNRHRRLGAGPDVRGRCARQTFLRPHEDPFHRQHRSRRHRAHDRNL